MIDIYVVIWHFPMDERCTELVGVFSTRERAEAGIANDAEMQGNHVSEYEIIETVMEMG